MKKEFENLSVKTFIMISSEFGGFNEEDAKLFEAIKRFGSISMAAKHIGEDYRLAWSKIDKLEKIFKCKLVERILGGVGGGSAKLTIEGEILLQKYLLAKRKLKAFNEKDLLKANLSIYGSHCPALEILVKYIEENFRNFFVEYISIGSREGLNLILEGYADISGIHLFDEKTGEYNTFLLKDKKIRDKIAIIRGYRREQGIIVKKGNPKKIFSLEDLLRKDVIFINRNKGSGTRFLIDNMISSLSLKNDLDFTDIIMK